MAEPHCSPCRSDAIEARCAVARHSNSVAPASVSGRKEASAMSSGRISGRPVGDRQHRPRSLRAVIEHPELELVGLYVYSEAKEGQDAGTLCGLATDGRARHPRRRGDRGAASRTASSTWGTGPTWTSCAGCSSRVRTSCRRAASSTIPTASDPGLRRRIEDACARGGSIALQHRFQPRVHHRGPAVGPAVHAAPAGPPDDRGVRRHVVAQLAGDDLRPHGVRP